MNQLSERVLDELDAAAGHIRNALNFASRTEKPTTIGKLSSILQSIEDLPLFDQQVEASQRFQENLVRYMNGDKPSTL